jgi:hypothetical protein
MEGQLCVLLYSKYSQYSKRFTEMLNQASVDFTAICGLNSLCIDNDKIRNQITKSAKIEITVVPCILIVFPDGGVEKYEGANAFKWADEIISKHAPPQPPQQQPLQPSYDSDNSKIQITKKRKTKKKPEITLIDELDSEDGEDGEDGEQILNRPLVGIRGGAGNYENGEFGEPEMPNRTVTRGIKATTEPTTSGKETLMTTAMAMQKSREQLDSKTQPVGSSL